MKFDKQKIIDLYNSNHNTEQISKILDVSQTSLYNFIKKENIKTHSNKTKKLSEEQIEEIISMHLSGMFLKDIAATFNVVSSTICKILKKVNGNENKTPVIVKDINTYDTLGYNKISFQRKTTLTDDDLNLYIPEKWKR